MEPQGRALRAAGHELTDPRQARGRRPPLAAIRVSMGVTMRWGSRRPRATADRGHDRDQSGQ